MSAVRLWGPVALYTGLIFWICSASRPIPGQQYFPQMDKLCHAVEYGPYAALWLRAIRGGFGHLSWRKSLLLALAATALVGALDEYYQSFVPLKSSDLWDIAADTFGALIGLWFCRRWAARIL